MAKNPLALDSSAMEMWNNLGDQEYIENMQKAANKVPKVKKLPDIPREMIQMLIDYSNNVIQESEKQMRIYLNEEKYFKANEMRVLRIYHNNNIIRLNRILNGQNPIQ